MYASVLFLFSKIIVVKDIQKSDDFLGQFGEFEKSLAQAVRFIQIHCLLQCFLLTHFF